MLSLNASINNTSQRNIAIAITQQSSYSQHLKVQNFWHLKQAKTAQMYLKLQQTHLVLNRHAILFTWFLFHSKPNKILSSNARPSTNITFWRTTPQPAHIHSDSVPLSRAQRLSLYC